MSPEPRPGRAGRGAYVLFEVILAVTVFSVVVVGLAVALSEAVEATNDFRREAAVRKGLESMLVEAKSRPRKEMAMRYRDERLGVDYATELRELRLTNRDGRLVNGLWVLRATATYEHSGEPATYTAEVYVHRP